MFAHSGVGGLGLGLSARVGGEPKAREALLLGGLKGGLGGGVGGLLRGLLGSTLG